MKNSLILLLLLNIYAVCAQTVVIPDANFRNKLLESYPEVMEGDELNLAAAASFTDVLDLRNAAIEDATGIEYFTSLITLNLSNNLLTSIPSISATLGLINFYASNNRLTSIPDMSSLTQLRDFQAMQNQLTQLPALSPTNLRSLYCSGNQLTSFPSLTNFSLLRNLVIGENPFEHPIDFSACTELLQLHIHKTGCDTIIGLEKLTKLTSLYAWGNSIKNLSALDSITTLTHCVIYNNPIESLPYLANKPNLSMLTVVHCMLTFEDILPVIATNTPETFDYVPQRSLPFQDIEARAQNNLTISYPIESPDANNIYVWYKDDVLLDSSASPNYTFAPLSFTDSGTYVLKVYNPQLPTLTLSSVPFTIDVKPCVEFELRSVHVANKECGIGYTIDVSSARISGGTAPFQYELTNAGFNQVFDDAYIEKIPAGKYTIQLIDAKQCRSSDEFVLNKIEKCDPVITPNGDGIADTYFIEHTGKVHIYDARRQLINTLNGPIVWDGTDRNGVLLDSGYYIIIPENQKPIYITLIR